MKALVKTVDIMFYKLMRLIHDLNYTKASQRASKFKENVKWMCAKKNPQTKTKRRSKRKTSLDLYIIDLRENSTDSK